jgi:uncharacterized protein involved in exopolysaccharide biosynthesis
MAEDKTLYDYWLVVYRQRAVVLLTVASAMAAAWILSKTLPPVFEAQCDFFFIQEMLPSSFFSPDSGPARRRVFPMTISELERSYKSIVDSNAILRLLRERISAEFRELDIDELDVDVAVTRDHVMRVTVWGPDPEMVARVANAYPQVVDDFLNDLTLRRQQEVLKAMEEEFSDAQRQLAAARDELRDFLLGQGASNVSNRARALMERRQTLEAEIQTTQAQIAAVDRRILEAEERFRSEAANEAVERLGSESMGARRETAPRGPQDSFYEQLRREVIESHVERAALEAKLASQRRSLREVMQRAGSSPTQRLREEEMEAGLGRARRMVESLAVRTAEMRAQANTRYDQVVILEEAETPTKPAFPIPLFDTLLAAPLGLLAGVYLAFLYDYILRVRRPRVAELQPT